VIGTPSSTTATPRTPKLERMPEPRIEMLTSSSP
jgi:hypothetical protein